MSRNRRLVQIALFAALGLGTTTAVFAQAGWTDGQSGRARGGLAAFSAMDTNGDGYVSVDEHATFRAQRRAANAQSGRLLRNAGNAPQFADIDADSDGRLSPTEMARFREQRIARSPCNRGGQAGWGWQR